MDFEVTPTSVKKKQKNKTAVFSHCFHYWTRFWYHLEELIKNLQLVFVSFAGVFATLSVAALGLWELEL